MFLMQGLLFFSVNLNLKKYTMTSLHIGIQQLPE